MANLGRYFSGSSKLGASWWGWIFAGSSNVVRSLRERTVDIPWFRHVRISPWPSPDLLHDLQEDCYAQATPAGESVQLPDALVFIGGLEPGLGRICGPEAASKQTGGRGCGNWRHARYC